jgi:NADPH-dependent 2,4-dienoyl-CoA reductase/sulfur reductase-like enzyme
MAQATVNGQARPEPSLNGSNTNGGPDTLVTDLLIIGPGPAGASLACSLASHGK